MANNSASSTSSSTTNSVGVRVGEIFSFAGNAFSKLGELTMHLQAYQEMNGSAGQKWDEEDVEMLRTAVRRFGEDLNKVAESVKQKTNLQVKSGIRKKHLDDSLVSPSQLPASSTSAVSFSPATSSTNHNRSISSKSLVFEDTPVVESEKEVYG